MSFAKAFDRVCPLWPLEPAKRAMVVAGCAGMAYTQLTTSPATVQFARSMGATGLHIGILGALPLGLVCMQLLSAVAVQHVSRRKPLWLCVSIVQRLIFLPAALGPWLLPQVRRHGLDLDADRAHRAQPRDAALLHAAVAVVDGRLSAAQGLEQILGRAAFVAAMDGGAGTVGQCAVLRARAASTCARRSRRSSRWAPSWA